MPEARLRRHDLVWLDPADAARLGVADADRAGLAAWLARRLPLVVGRQVPQLDGLRLGFTLPGTGPRRRVEVRAPLAAILTHDAPPLLEAVLGAAPAAWQAPLHAVVRSFGQVGLRPRAYGSLVTQAFSGEACLRPGSDVDLLIDCRSRAEAEAALAVLEAFGDGPPRLDGELHMPHGWAVAWRELTQTRASGGQLLAKSDSGVQLMGAEDFLGAPTTLGAVNGNPGHALAAC